MELGFGNVDRVCRAAQYTASSVTLDLSSATFIRPFGLIYLGMFVRRSAQAGLRVTVKPPIAANVREYMARQHFWEVFNFDMRGAPSDLVVGRPTLTSLNNMINVSRDASLVDDLAIELERFLEANSIGINRDDTVVTITELVDNFVQHSRADLPGVFALQWYPNLKRLSVAVADGGIGIRASLATNARYTYLEYRPHREAAQLAFDPLVTRRASGGGTGLAVVADAITNLGGRFWLATGDAYVRITNGRMAVGPMGYDLAGVIADLDLPTA